QLEKQTGLVGVGRHGLPKGHQLVIRRIEALALLRGRREGLLVLADAGLELIDLLLQIRVVAALGAKYRDPERDEENDEAEAAHECSVAALHQPPAPGSTVLIVS